jgi:hypothetical protein
MTLFKLENERTGETDIVQAWSIDEISLLKGWTKITPLRKA